MKRQAPSSAAALIIEITRGNIVESEHQVSIAVVDVRGQSVMAFGDMKKPIYLRSSAKPFQALPLVEQGYAESLKISSQQLAILCASHAGTDRHVEVVREILEKNDLSETDLQCGSHPPNDRNTAARLLSMGEPSLPIRHNCSGKHAGMLLYSRAVSEDIQLYLQQDGKTQQAILDVFSEMVEVPKHEIKVGIDGCSAPNFAIPLPAAAFGYARLMDPSAMGEARGKSCNRIVEAMTSHPEMIAGIGRFDRELMQAVKGRLLAKGGAEGYQAIGIPPNQISGGSALGIAIKVHDGESGKRAISVTTLAVLRLLGLITAEEQANLAAFDERPLFNYSNIAIGNIRLTDQSRIRLQEAYERI